MINNSHNISDSSISDNSFLINETYKKKYQKYKIKYIKLLEIHGGKKGSSSNRGNKKTKKGNDDDESSSEYNLKKYDNTIESQYNSAKFDDPDYLEKYQDDFVRFNDETIKNFNADEIEADKRLNLAKYRSIKNRCRGEGKECLYNQSYGGKKGNSTSRGNRKTKKGDDDDDDDDDEKHSKNPLRYYVNKYTKIPSINNINDSLNNNKNDLLSKKEMLILPGIVIASLCMITSIISNL
jgi:hypothetical protein